MKHLKYTFLFDVTLAAVILSQREMNQLRNEHDR